MDNVTFTLVSSQGETVVSHSVHYSHGNLGPSIEHTHHGEPIAAGDTISRKQNQSPFYTVVALDGDWAWVKDAQSGAYGTVFHAHFTRKGAVLEFEPARQELAA